MTAPAPLVFAVDGGNSKAEALLVDASGRILAAVRSATASHQQVGLASAMEAIQALADRASGLAGIGRRPVARFGSYCLAGADYPAETRRLGSAIGRLGLTDRTTVRNDTLAALRAGASRSWGVALICGQGVNGVAVAPSGRTARFDAVGAISGDWGGGRSVGMAALAAAVRAADGRGTRTDLRGRVPAHFGLRTPAALVRALYDGRIAEARTAELSPLVFATADEGDAVAGAIVDRLADELATMAIALLRRTGQLRLDAEIVLAGGVLRAGHERLNGGLMERIRRVAPRVIERTLREPPVLGAALLGLADAGLAGPALIRAAARARHEIGGRAFEPVVPAVPADRALTRTGTPSTR